MIVIIIDTSGITQNCSFHGDSEQAVYWLDSLKPHHTHQETRLIIIPLSLTHLVCSVVHIRHAESLVHNEASEYSLEVHGDDAIAQRSGHTFQMHYDGQKWVLSLTEQKHGNHQNETPVGVGLVTVQFLLGVQLQIRIALHSQPILRQNTYHSQHYFGSSSHLSQIVRLIESLMQPSELVKQ